MPSWTVKMPSPGQMVRVNRGRYFHYGICIAPGRLIHFASPYGDGFDDPASATVHETDLSAFSGGGFVECMELTRAERAYALSAKDCIAAAKAALGQKGYDVINNNCLHFANRCFWGNSEGPKEKHRGFLGCLKP